MQTCFMNHRTKCPTSSLPAYFIREKLYKYSANSAHAISYQISSTVLNTFIHEAKIQKDEFLEN